MIDYNLEILGQINIVVFLIRKQKGIIQISYNSLIHLHKFPIQNFIT